MIFRILFILEYKTSASIVRKIRTVEDFISRHAELFNEEEIEERRSCTFDLKICYADEEFMSGWPTFKDDIFEEPLNSSNCLGLGIHQVIMLFFSIMSIFTN